MELKTRTNQPVTGELTDTIDITYTNNVPTLEVSGKLYVDGNTHFDSNLSVDGDISSEGDVYANNLYGLQIFYDSFNGTSLSISGGDLVITIDENINRFNLVHILFNDDLDEVTFSNIVMTGLDGSNTFIKLLVPNATSTPHSFDRLYCDALVQYDGDEEKTIITVFPPDGVTFNITGIRCEYNVIGKME